MATASLSSNTTGKALSFVINKISRLKSLSSRLIIIENSPWQIQISHRDHSGTAGGENALAIHLHCLNVDGRNPSWSYAAMAIIELLTFDGSGTPFTDVIGPWIFNKDEKSWARNRFILWTELFDRRAGYVKHDRIRINVKILVQKLQSPSCSLIFQQVFHVFQIHFRIENVRGLMAAATQRFVFSGMQWKIVVRKNQSDQSSYLGVMLFCMPSDNETTHHWVRNIFSEFHLNSEHGDHTCRFDETKKFTNKKRCHGISKFIAWSDLMNPQNGYVRNNGIEFSVFFRDDSRCGNSANNNSLIYSNGNRNIQIRFCAGNFTNINGDGNAAVNGNGDVGASSNQGDGGGRGDTDSAHDGDDSDENKDANTNDVSTITDAATKWLCSICLENMAGREILSSFCGHVYCKSCILTSMKFRKQCPNCRAVLTNDLLHPLYYLSS